MKAIYKIILILSCCLLIAISTMSQNYFDNNDYSFAWKDVKLKGKVLSMQCNTYGYKFKFGEYERDNTPKDVSPTIFYNKDGKISKVIYDNMVCDKYTYEDGKLLSIFRLELCTKIDAYKRNRYGEYKTGGNYKPIYETGEKYQTFDTTDIIEYLYDGDNVIEINAYYGNPNKLSKKIKYKYTSTGYEEKTYNGDGSLIYYVIMDGNKKTEGDNSFGPGGKFEQITIYNEKMLAIKETIISSGGPMYNAMELNYYYKYNDHGDLISCAEASNGEPFRTVQYSYDNDGNWIERKEFNKGNIDFSITRTIKYAKNDSDYDNIKSEFSKEYIDKEIARLKAIKAQHAIEDSIKEAKLIAEIKRKQAIEDSIKMVKYLKDVYSDCLFLFDNDKDFVSCMLQENDKKMKDLTSRISKKIQNVSSVVINGKELLDKNLGAGEKMQDICNAYLIFEKEFGYDAEVTRETRNQLEEFVQSRKNLKNKFRQFSTNSGGYGLQLCAFLTCYIMGL